MLSQRARERSKERGCECFDGRTEESCKARGGEIILGQKPKKKRSKMSGCECLE